MYFEIISCLVALFYTIWRWDYIFPVGYVASFSKWLVFLHACISWRELGQWTTGNEQNDEDSTWHYVWAATRAEEKSVDIISVLSAPLASGNRSEMELCVTGGQDITGSLDVYGSKQVECTVNQGMNNCKRTAYGTNAVGASCQGIPGSYLLCPVLFFLKTYYFQMVSVALWFRWEYIDRFI